MVAKIITLANQKGGVGKTTATMVLAASLAKMWEAKVLILDADDQGTANAWAEMGRRNNAPFPADVIKIEKGLIDSVHEEIPKYIDDYHYILIDCPPNTLTMPASALLVSDLALVITVPSGTDVWSTTRFIEFVDEKMSVNQDLQARLLLNQVEKNRRVSNANINTIEAMNMHVLPASFARRSLYKEISMFGATVYDFGNSKEVLEVIQESENVAKAVVKVLSYESKTASVG